VVEAAGKRGFIYGLDRRRVHCRSPHSSLNALLQSAGGIICKQWLIQFDKAMQAEGYTHGFDGDYAMCAWVHDEIQVACHEDIAQRVGEIAVETIEQVTAIFNFKCPLTGEFNVGNNWAETH
jgi:DNA polymerase I-like protein with 3'-5' exonuclease and polymerase domains